MKRIFLITTLIFIAIIAFSVPNYAQQTFTNVSDLDEFKKAIANGDSVILTKDITVTETLEIPASYTGIIKSDKKTLTLDAGVENMFEVNSKNLSFENVVLDGAGKGRLIFATDGAKLSLKDAVVKNGSTDSFEKKIDQSTGINKQIYSGGGIYLLGSTLNAENTVFQANRTKVETPNQENIAGAPQTAPHGGAIMATGKSTINIIGGEFIDNHTGAMKTKEGPNGEGGAIKLEDSTLHINDENVTDKAETKFTGNHLFDWESKGGLQGGSIEATDSKVYIYGAAFQIPGPFNTGGAIKFENCPEAIIKNSDFKIDANKGGFGMAGGAITSEGSHLSIDNSDFKTGSGTYVREAGGLIQVVSTGSFELTNSHLEGNGVAWNETQARKTAKYGGAINFYNASTVKAKIENTTIENFTSEISGAGIGISTQAASKLDKTTEESMANRTCPAAITLELVNTKLINNVTYSYDNGSYGGGMFIGSGSTVSMRGGQISSEVSTSTGGGIYNEGHLTLQGGAKVINNKAYHMAGGILNDGYLKVDDATISGNVKGDWSNSNQHIYNKDEMTGQNIYAAKDVIITPKANFDGNDIRVLHGQSAVLLTGTYPRQLNISISESEEAKTAPNDFPANVAVQESQHRHVGYIVAKGTEGYTPTETDAQNLHYVTKDKSQATSDFSDHKGVGAWDYVLDPKTKNVVLGQRAKMVFHANGTDKNHAKFEDNKAEKETLYTIYSSKTPWTSPEQMQELKEEPTRDGFTFTGWYYSVNSTNENSAPDTNNENSIQQITDPATVAEYLLKFDEVKFTGKLETAGANTSSNSNPAMMRSASVQTSDENGKGITSIVSPYIINTYAGWAQTIDIPVQKSWIDTEKEDQKAVTIRLFADGKEVKSLKLDANDNSELNWKDKFKNLPVYQQKEDGSYESIKYTIKEDTLGTDYKDPEINPNSIDAVTQLEAQKNDETGSEFTVKNQKIYKFDLTVTKNWEDDNNKEGLRPESVSITLTPSSGDPIKAVIDSKTNTYTFKNLQKKDAKNKEITYKLSEDEVANYKTKEILQPTFDKNDPSKATASITNSREVEYITLLGEKVWDDANNQDGKRPTSITVNVKRGEDVVATKEVKGTGNTWSYEFEKLPKYVDGKEAVYTVEEAKTPDGYTVTIDGTKITNSYKPQVMNLNVEKIWDDANNQDGKRPDSITVSLIKNGQATDKKITIKDDGNGKWQGTFKDLPVFENGNEIKYTIKEELVEGYNSSIENYKITNSYKPEIITIFGQKTWDDEENKYGKRPDVIKVSLMKGDQVIQTVEVKSDENDEWNYSFDPVDKYEAGKLINYSVKEDPVEGYKASYSETGYNITNIYRPEPKPEPEPTPEPNPTPEPEKQKEHVEKQDEATKSPQTGDNGFAIYTLILALSLGGTLVINSRKQNKLEEK